MTAQTAPDKFTSHGILGSLLLAAGLLLLVLRGFESMQPLAGFPRFWHHNEILWWGLGFAVFAFGAWLLARSSSPEDRGWRPARAGRRFEKLILYTRTGCHLCDDARKILDEHARWLPTVVEIDIDHDPRLIERFGTCVPVVSIDGKVRFRGRVEPVLLRRLIDATPILPS